MLQDDIIGRLILDLAALEDRVIGRCVKHDFEDALGDLETAWERLLDVPREIVERVDGDTLAQLVGNEPAKLRGASQLLALEAKVFAYRGQTARAAACTERSNQLAERAETHRKLRAPRS
ncbi:hypothetical protein BH11MYX1_BH11MYX1_04070 [soil metagenome]